MISITAISSEPLITGMSLRRKRSRENDITASSK